ncbi:uncharacterized protein LOC116738449 [Nasonia vitripennis]|uniref:Uncharacterized protein n=1 Tax=Nasonia vitripennis TaxID=7425 RepID=A0A7M7QA48_NASVI|nr:uncharacterized protein LOC116738449 [Nasonia vitripennis]
MLMYLQGCTFHQNHSEAIFYHIGHDMWVSENEYTGFINKSTTPQAATNITTLVFTMEKLLSSTKTGFKSRRNGVGKEQCGTLDPVKLAVCEAFYKFRVENEYTPVTTEDDKN